ncbi:MAG: hypothetical protein FWB74_03160 [Defluviitaleaceae bacterium]|nr:hypothetical protein [Defluviitaleaceae bacterium]
MDEQTTKKWRKGLVFFCVFAVLIFSMTTMPDGTSLFHGFLGLFGIRGMVVHNGVTTYVANIIVILAIIFCGLAAWNIWYGYRRQFGELKWHLYRLPVFIAIFLLLFSGVLFQPSPIDRIYFAAMARREGVPAITVRGSTITLRYVQNPDGIWVYEYDFLLHHHSDGSATFYVKFIYSSWNIQGVREKREVFIACPEGEPTKFSVFGAGTMTFRGEIERETEILGGVTQIFHAVLLVLVDVYGNEHIPPRLVRFR